MNAFSTLKGVMHGGAPLYGFMVKIPSPATVELIGFTGFDFVVIDIEHGAIGIETVVHMLRAAELSGTRAVVRLPSAAPELIQHVLDAGAEGIMVPHVATATEAQRVVEHAYYPPLGKRGVGSLGRSARYGTVPPATFFKERAERTAVIVMIEDASALPDIEAIARTSGIDGIMIGANDLAASMGHVNNSGHPEVQEAIANIRKTVNRVAAEGSATAPILVDVAASDSAEPALALVEKGVRMICYNSCFVLMRALERIRRDLRVGASA